MGSPYEYLVRNGNAWMITQPQVGTLGRSFTSMLLAYDNQTQLKSQTFVSTRTRLLDHQTLH